MRSLLVHTAALIPDEKCKAFRLEWPDSLTEIFPIKMLPANWRISPPPIETMEIGNRWAKERRSAVLALPGAISPADTNFLLNPEHRDFRRIRIAPPIDFAFDPRLLGR